MWDQTFANPDPAIAMAWAEIIGDLDMEDCLTAVAEHYTNETRRLMPKDVIAGVKRIRLARLDYAVDEMPDCDPDDVHAYLRALRENRRKRADGTEVERPVGQLLAATASQLPAIPRRDCPNCNAAGFITDENGEPIARCTHRRTA